MPPTPRPYQRVLVALLGVALVGAWALALLSSRPGSARAAGIGALQQKIDQSKGAVSSLAGQVTAETTQIDRLGNNISALENRIAAVQADLNAKQDALLTTRAQLNAAHTRLNRLQAYLTRANALLTRELVSSYEGDTPDIVSVVLDSTGFQDLLEKLSFQQRIHKENALVINTVRAARRAVVVEAIRLGALQVREQKLARIVLSQRNRLYNDKVELVDQQIAIVRRRDRKSGKLSDARGRLSSLEGQLHTLQVQQAAAAARALARQRAAQQAAASDTSSGSASGSSSSSGASSAAPPAGAAPSTGGFAFPLPKGSVSGPGSWSPDDGVDMSAPGDTPEYAVCSGTIVLHGIGGFGPWAPVIHCDSSLGGYSYVYYGHAGPLYQLAVGTHVSAGQVMSSVGPGIVGISTGPHIEIGFCDGSGTPIGPGSAGTMMSLLQSAW